MSETAQKTAGVKSPKTQETPNLLPWFFKGYLRPQAPKLAGALFFMTLEGAMLGALSYLIKPMFDNVLVSQDGSAILWVSLGVLGVFILRAVSAYANRVLMTMLRQKTAANLQKDLVAHVLTLDGAFFHQYPPGILLERTRGDCQAASFQWGQIFSTLIKDAIGLASLLIVAMTIDWVWTLVVLFAVPLIGFPVVHLQKRVRRNSRDAREASSQVSNRLDEVFHGSTQIKLSGTEARETHRFSSAINTYVREELRAVRGQAAIPSLIDFVAGLGFCAVLYFGAHEILAGEKTVGDFMAFFTAMGLVFEPARRLGNVSGLWQMAMASLERVYGIFLEQPEITSPAKPVAMPANVEKSDLTLTDIRFSYAETPVLRGTTFTAKAGETTALVGASGAGKSTIFNLLTRLIDPQSGQVTLGDVPTNKLDLAALRNQFSVVSQDALLFDESIRDNILMGTQATEDQLKTAMQAAHIEEFVSKLDKGLDTPAGSRGSALSGGQRQRVAIARAILRDRPILLLDEATSALDAQSEKIVQNALEQLSEGRTTIVIAHRLSTIRDADKIVVMDKGQVVDEGTHEELLARGGLYADLYRLQYADGRTVSDGSPVRALPGQPQDDSAEDAKGSGILAATSRMFGSVMGLFGRARD